MKIAADSTSASPVWFRRDLDNCHGGAVLIDDKLFGCGCRQGGKNFYCVDFLTGQTRKLDKSLGKVGIHYADGMLYCLNHRGMMSLLAVTADGFEIVSQFDLGKKPDNTYPPGGLRRTALSALRSIALCLRRSRALKWQAYSVCRPPRLTVLTAGREEYGRHLQETQCAIVGQRKQCWAGADWH